MSEEDRASKKAQSRNRILESAREVFFRDGFMSANLDEVADKAGVAKGTLYRYFDSKADLYVAVLADNGNVFVEKMRNAVSTSGSAMERLQAVAAFYFDHWVNHQNYFQIFWAVDNQPVIGSLPSSVVDEVSRLWEGSLAILSEIIESGVNDGEFGPCDPWEVANILWTLANAIIQSESAITRRQLRRVPLEQSYHDAIALMLAGLRQGPVAKPNTPG